VSAKFDIVIPTHNQARLTVKCLDSIHRAGGDHAVIWVDNGSDIFEKMQVQRFFDSHDMRYYAVGLPRNEGFVVATNIGMLLSRAPYVVLLNNDTEVPPGWLERMEMEARGSAVGIVGVVEETPEPSVGTISRREKMEAAIGRSVPFDSCRIRTMVPFFCCMLPRRTIEKVGLLSMRYSPGGLDDDDYCRRVSRAGLQILLDLSVLVKHVGGATRKAVYPPGEYERIVEDHKRIFEAEAAG
jgi:hypothetical protein